MKRSFFTYIYAAIEMITHAFPEYTTVFENSADACEDLYDYSFGVPKPSEMLVQILFRSNLNYLIGSYMALIQTIPSFALSGMRNVFEGIIRGYYYQCNEEAACASYLYMITQNEDGIGVENIDVEIMGGVVDQIEDVELKGLCQKVINKEQFSKEDKKLISDFDDPSRHFKNNIGKLYTKSVQKEMNCVWRELSRFNHAGIRGRFRDLHLEEERLPTYGRDLLSALLLLAGNVIMYLEVIDPKQKDVKFLGDILDLTEHIPKNWPNKKKYQGKFTYTSSEAINTLFDP